MRKFICSCVVAIAYFGGSLAQAAAPPATATITVHADQPGPKINRNIYGQFTEHLGRGIYEGIWVGENSSIPNTQGYRNDVIAALKKIRVPLMRWPGGCFADEYHWREGIGPRDQRPVKVNTNWGGVEENNAFGTHEFLNFAELMGADAYISGNIGSGSPEEMAEWVEYITSDSNSSLAQLRRKNGRDKPWRLPFFGLGNETWGCGGNMRPEYAADLHRRYQTYIKAPSDNRPLRIASGAHDEDYYWTEILLSQASKYMDGFSLHYYTFPGGRWESKGPSTAFPEDQWASTLQYALRIDELITKHSAIMDKYDAPKRIALFVDEWGTWYDTEPGQNPGFLYQQNTLRDALVAAVTLDILHRHADRVRMSSVAQMVNVLQAMILTDKEKMILTPTYHVFDMYVPFQDATFLPTEVTTPQYKRADFAMPAVHTSAARGTDGRLHLSLVNLDPHQAVSVSVRITGASGRGATGRILTGSAMDAKNTFDQPNALQPQPFKGTRKGDTLVFAMPAKSVAVVAVDE